MRQVKHEIKQRRENGLGTDDLVSVEGLGLGFEKKKRKIDMMNKNKTGGDEDFDDFYDEEPGNAREYAGVIDDDVVPLPIQKKKNAEEV